MASEKLQLSGAMGLVFADGDTEGGRWQRYSEEILGHWRLPYRLGHAEAGLVVFASPPRLDVGELGELARRVRAGTCVVSVGGPGDLAAMAGCAVGRRRADGHVSLPKGGLLHAFGGVELTPGGARALARWEGGALAATEMAVGEGLVVTIGVDLWQTVVRIQQGWPVNGDGKPAVDGSAPVDDGVLKTDDAIALSYEHDRALPGGGRRASRYEHRIPAEPTVVPIFDRPQADLWRRFLLHLLLRLGERSGLVLPWLHYWPAGVEAVAHFSNDSDGNEDAAAESILDAWAEGGVRGTWCYLYPGGLGSLVLNRIAAEGHEVALHYNAHDGGDGCSWGFEQLRAQMSWLRHLLGATRVPTNKNHYLRWEGWDEFYRWCERVGIELDQSHGPSKQGNAGFPFGTAHLSFPLLEEGARLGRVLAQPLHFQDLWFTSPASNREILIRQALAEHGVAHFLFHGRNVRNHPEVRQALMATIARVKDAKLPIWTASQLNDWERARRGVDLEATENELGWTLRVWSRQPLTNAAIMIPAPRVAVASRFRVLGAEGRVSHVERHGLRHLEVALDLAAGEHNLKVEAAR